MEQDNEESANGYKKELFNEQIYKVAVSASCQNVAVITGKWKLYVKSLAPEDENKREYPENGFELKLSENEIREFQYLAFVGSDAIALVFNKNIKYWCKGSST